MVSLAMFEKAIQFLNVHKEIALATSEGNLPKLRAHSGSVPLCAP